MAALNSAEQDLEGTPPSARGPGAGGLAPPVAYGFAVTGAGDHRSTAAIAVMGAENQWNRGIVGCANDAVRQATFVDYCSGQEASVDITGHPQWGIRQRPSHRD